MLRRRAAVAACAYLTVDAAAALAYCTPEGAAHVRSADGFLYNHCQNSRGLQKVSSNMFLQRVGMLTAVLATGESVRQSVLRHTLLLCQDE